MLANAAEALTGFTAAIASIPFPATAGGEVTHYPLLASAGGAGERNLANCIGCLERDLNDEGPGEIRGLFVFAFFFRAG